MKKIRRAFTLIEMVIVLFIISLLLLIMIPNLVAQKDHASESSKEAFKTTLKTQAELFLENKKDNDTSKVVSTDDLVKENYISVSQQEKADKNLNIGKSDDILAKLNEQPKAK